MKRLLKFLINLVLAVVAVALTMVVVFLITPSWQKSLVEEALAHDTARKWQIGAVDIKPARMEVEEVFVLDGNVGASVRFVQVDGPLWKLVLFGELEVESGSVVDLDLDVSKVTVGDPTSLDYQEFLKRVSGDMEFWKERVALVLSKLTATGIHVHLQNVQIRGRVLMPGETSIPVRMVIEDADSNTPRMIRLAPLSGLTL